MTLRKELVRLAHANPELRPHILPLLKTAKEHVDFGNPAEIYDRIPHWVRAYAVPAIKGEPGWREVARLANIPPDKWSLNAINWFFNALVASGKTTATERDRDRFFQTIMSFKKHGPPAVTTPIW